MIHSLKLKKKTRKANAPSVWIQSSFQPYEHDNEFEIARGSITLIRELGTGNFGKVFEGTFKASDDAIQCVAVKTVKDEASDKEGADFLNEASIMKNFKTFRIIRLSGVISKAQPYFVVMELLSNGDLKTFLSKYRPNENAVTNYSKFSASQVVPQLGHMAIQIADGMAYLNQKYFVHGDLAARNCMVTAAYTIKIGYFGLTRDVYESNPVRWMTPECLKDGVFTGQRDIFSYGIVPWEIVTYAEQPYQGLLNEQVMSFVVNGGTE